MNELIRDPITARWIIVPREKSAGLPEFVTEERSKSKANCPFCYGGETLTPPEIVAHRKSGGANTPDWSVRVVPNKFPALRIEGELDRQGIGVFDVMNGVGAHEVIVDTPDHFRDMADLTHLEAEEVVWAYRARSLDLRKDKRFKYILIFKNYGKSAGASLEHPHSQLIALPIIPKRVHEEMEGAAKYYDYKERCVFCDIVREELEERERYWLEQFPEAININTPTRNWKERWVANREHNIAKHKEWLKANAEHVAEYREGRKEIEKAGQKARYDAGYKAKRNEAKKVKVACAMCGKEMNKNSLWEHTKKLHPMAE